MDRLLQITAHLPLVHLSAGEVLMAEGQAGGALWVLVSGALQVRKGDMAVNTVDRPGAVLGEMALLLGGGASASVVALAPSVLRHAEDGHALLAADPAVTHAIALGLAERLNFVTTYLADLKHQYGHAPGLAMVADVLQQLSERRGPPVRPGSRREPEPLD